MTTNQKRQRYYCNFKEDLIKKNLYLFKNILKVEDSRKFKCKACSSFFGKEVILFFENLDMHLGSATHEKTATNKTLKDDLGAAKLYLDSQKNVNERLQDEKTEIKEDRTMEEEEAEDEEFEKKVNNQQTEPELLIQNNQIYFRFQVTNFILQNNLPFKFADEFAKFLTLLFKTHDFESLSKFNLNKKHITKIANQCIGPHVQNSYLKKLEDTFFSISLDEGSIQGRIEYLMITARFFETNDSERTTTKLLSVLELEGSRTGETLHKFVENFLFTGFQGRKRKNNLIGIATDHAPNMISERDAGITNRYFQELPYLVITHDLCHALNLVFENAVEAFPNKYRRIVTKIASAFSRSPNKTANFKTFIKEVIKNKTEIVQIMTEKEEEEEKKEEINMKVLSILRYVENRWSSFHDALSRIIELSEPLKLFFEGDPKSSSEEKSYFNKENILMLKLLLCLTGMLNDYIIDFQKDNLSTQEIVEGLKECQLLFGEYVLNLYEGNNLEGPFKDYNKIYQTLSPILIDKNDEKLYNTFAKKDTQFQRYFLEKHTEFEKLLEDADQALKIEFFNNAFEFLKTAFKEIRLRLPSPESIIFLTESFSLKNQDSITKIRLLAGKFKNVIAEHEVGLFNKELNKLQYRMEDIHSNISKQGFLKTWDHEKTKSPLVYKLIRALQTLPYSTVSLERNFSLAKDIKTLKRNKISTLNLQACLLAKQEFSGEIPFTRDMLDQYHVKARKSEGIRQKDCSILGESNMNSMIPIIEEEGLEDVDNFEENIQDQITFKNEDEILRAAELISFRKYLQSQQKENMDNLMIQSQSKKRRSETKIWNDQLKKMIKAPEMSKVESQDVVKMEEENGEEKKKQGQSEESIEEESV